MIEEKGVNIGGEGAGDGEKMAAALGYARMGWPVFPVHNVRNGMCSCGRAKCRRAGKHPRTEHGLKDASTDPNIIEQWGSQWPDANVGIVTGMKSGIVVLDIDPRNGGDKSLRDLVARHGELPPTPKVTTGGGGIHFYFAHPGITTPSKAGLAPGVDLKGDGGYVLAPDSTHASGRVYAWDVSHRLGIVPLAPVPDWVMSMAKKRHDGPVPTSEVQGFTEGSRNSALARIAGFLRHLGLGEQAITNALLASNRVVCFPPMHDDEVAGISHSVARYPAGCWISVPSGSAQSKGGRPAPARTRFGRKHRPKASKHLPRHDRGAWGTQTIRVEVVEP